MSSPITELRRFYATSAGRRAIVTTQRSRAAAVMMSGEAYERTRHHRKLLRLHARGEKEIAAGKGCDLDALFTDADALLVEGH